jgi:hypothetical protein
MGGLTVAWYWMKEQTETYDDNVFLSSKLFLFTWIVLCKFLLTPGGDS